MKELKKLTCTASLFVAALGVIVGLWFIDVPEWADVLAHWLQPSSHHKISTAPLIVSFLEFGFCPIVVPGLLLMILWKAAEGWCTSLRK